MPGAHSNLGVVLCSKRESSTRRYRRIPKGLRNNPNYAEAHTNLGNAFFKTGNWREAIEQYQMAIKINPKFAQAHANLGVAFIQKGQLDDAITQFQEALRLNPNLSGVRDALAKAQALVGEGRK